MKRSVRKASREFNKACEYHVSVFAKKHRLKRIGWKGEIGDVYLFEGVEINYMDISYDISTFQPARLFFSWFNDQKSETFRRFCESEERKEDMDLFLFDLFDGSATKSYLISSPKKHSRVETIRRSVAAIKHFSMLTFAEMVSMHDVSDEEAEELRLSLTEFELT
jgi:hypothetical protein